MMPMHPRNETESPSLGKGQGQRRAFELKFLIAEPQAEAVGEWSLRRLSPDPHGHPELDGAYPINSVYLDSPTLDVLHRTKGYRRRKYRIRRYGASSWAFLERKTKSGDRVSKRRIAVPESDIPLLQCPTSPVDWPGHWFHQRLQELRLAPACRISYQRTAFVGESADGPLRLTLDRRLQGVLTDRWDLSGGDAAAPLLHGQVILELKFRAALPGMFKELIAEMRLDPGRISKYRLCHAAWGTRNGAAPAAPT